MSLISLLKKLWIVFLFPGFLCLGVLSESVALEKEKSLSWHQKMPQNLPRSLIKGKQYGSKDPLKEGLSLVAAGETERARFIRNGMPASFDQHLLTWVIATYGKNISAREVIQTARKLSGWPGTKDKLICKGERLLFHSKAHLQEVVSLFGNSPPQTAEGAIIFSQSLLARKDFDGARKAILAFWSKKKLSPALEKIVLQKFSRLLTSRDHRIRMENMLYQGHVDAAQRIARLARAESLAAAWGAVLRKHPEAERYLQQVPSAQRSSGYLFAMTRYLRKKERFLEAARIMSKIHQSPDPLIDGDAWWKEQRALSRELLDLGHINLAYQIVTKHLAEKSDHVSDAEFHAGWYALQGLKNPDRAQKHFLRLLKICKGLSCARALYWLGRSSEAQNSPEASHYFTRAAQYPANFYGQLATARIGHKRLSLRNPVASGGDHGNFSQRSAVRAIQRLETAGFSQYAYPFYHKLARQLSSSGELSLLMAMARKRQSHFLVLKIGKIAAQRGMNVGTLAHPTGAIPSQARITESYSALAHAIARQESEFQGSAISPAGAKGLMQLMPDTARQAAKRMGIAYSHERLTSDVAYNAALGANILEMKLSNFGGSPVLGLAAYNAGVHRAKSWIQRYGDPRGKPIDAIVDWIERIPFAETRSYVQRVIENYQVYKARLLNRFDIITDLTKGS